MTAFRTRRRRSAASPQRLEILEGRVLFASFTWDGGGGDDNWTTAANWAGDAAPSGSDPADTLVFPSSAARKSNTNDFPDGTAFDAITIQAGGYTLAGNRITLGAIALADTSLSGGNEVSFDIELSGACTVIDDDGASNEALTLSGVISGSGSLTKDGSGSVILTQPNTYTGGTTLSSGNTFANNASGSAFGAGGVTNTSGTLRGQGGFTGALTHNAGLAPGATNPGGGAAGILATGAITFGSAASFGVNVFGTSSGPGGYDQLVVTGAVDLDSGHSLIASGTYTATGGEKLFIIINDDTDMITGTFSGLSDPDNDTVSINGTEYRISYTGDSESNAVTGGNDVVLYTVENLAPVVTVPGAQGPEDDEIVEFSAANGNAITVADPDAGSAVIQLSLVVNQNAIITVPDTSLITGGESGTHFITLTGTIPQLNAAIDGMRVFVNGASAPITLTLTADDDGNSGVGGPRIGQNVVTINVDQVNDAPVNTVPGPQAVVQNSTLLFNVANANRIMVADVDNAGVFVTLTATNGTVSLGEIQDVAIGAGDPSGDTSITFSGALAAMNAALLTTAFTPTPGFNGAASLQVATSDFEATDTDTISITVSPPGVLAFSAATYSVAEDAGAAVAVITVSRTGGSAGVATVAYATANGTATAGTDYTAASGTLTFADGETSKTFNVPINDDAPDEADETVNLTLGNVTGGTPGAQTSAVLTIVDNDAMPTISPGAAKVVEGNAGTAAATFDVTLSEPSGRTITIDYATEDITAAAGSDYVATSGTLTFAPGETTKTVVVNATGDASVEADERFQLVLTNPINFDFGGAISRGTAGTIVDDDDPARTSISIARDVTVNEGDAGTSNATFTVNLNRAAAGTVTVAYATSAQSDTAADDFLPTTGVLTFTPGQTSKTVAIPVVGDASDDARELNQTLRLTLSNPTGGSVLVNPEFPFCMLTVTDDDDPPSISVADQSGVENPEDGNGSSPTTFAIPVTLSAPSEKAVTVAFATESGTALGETDYAPVSGVLTFAPGETSKTINLATVPDLLDEADESFAVTLSNVTNAVVEDGQSTITITDDDVAPTLSVGGVTFAEPANPGTTATGTFTVTLSAATGNQVTVDFATSNGTATAGSDYTANSGTLTFAPGETSKTIDVTALFDGTTEPAETFALALTNPTNTAVQPADDLVTIGTINDTPPNAAPVAADDVVTLAAGQSSATIDVVGNDTDAEDDSLTVTVTGAPASGTAVANADGTITYTPTDATAAGADSFTYTVTDSDGGTDTATVNVTITGNGTAPNAVNPNKQDVFVAATGGDDDIQVVRVGRSVQILVNGQDQGTFTSKTTGNIVISGGDGNDTLVLGKVKTPVLFNGGEGDDELGGGSRGDILIGGPGADTLNGGAGRDILIGGDGADTITGLGASDILVAGTTIYDADTTANRAALNDLLAALAAGGRYAAKLANFTGSDGVGTSDARLAPGTTVFDDGDVDTLFGGGSADFFAADTDGAAIDVLTRKARNESVVEL